MEFEIELLNLEEDRKECALLMSTSEPWITLRRDYNMALKMFRNPHVEKYIIKREREVIGFAIINLKGAFVGYIQSIAIKPEWRGKGIGQRLLKFCENRIFSEVPNIFICASSFNTKALEWYKRSEYKVVGELKDYIVRGHSEILLRKTISPLADFRSLIL